MSNGMGGGNEARPLAMVVKIPKMIRL